MHDRKGDAPRCSPGNAYCVTSIDRERRVAVIAAGMSFPQALGLRKALAPRWPDVTFIVEPEPDPAQYTFFPPIYQIIGVNQDRSRTMLMQGMTLEEAEAARDALLDTRALVFLWIWIERESNVVAEANASRHGALH